ncbi:MAG: hypothetical protein HY867_09140 [Chloroflexi bacterium]|nr:hypothetical protein [Chloroflexota bacterium]
MFTDLFRALLHRKNPRGHPILSALAYAFCPAAARWWLAGADPTPPFDPVWQSLQDLTSGGTLADHLNRYGFGGLMDEIKKYVQEVKAWRALHPIPAPELLPLFRGGSIPAGLRFGSQNAIQNLGGDWRNLFGYVRVWAYLSQDWRRGMGIAPDADFTLSCETVSLTLPGIRIPLQFETWVWKLAIGHVTETRLGLFVQRRQQDELRFALLRRSSPPGDQPWPNSPLVFALDRETGEADHHDPLLADGDLERLVQSLSHLAKNGPHPPLNALHYPSTCSACGYQNVCFDKHTLSPHALAHL